MQIAVLDDYQSLAQTFAAWDRLDGRARLQFFAEPIADPAVLIETLLPFDAVCLMRERTPFPQGVIEALPNLKLIVTTGMKNASIDVAAAVDRGITVCGTPSPGHATAELAWALMLALARRLVPQTNALQGGQWQRGIGRDLRGATLGILGLGRLGSQMAGYARAFGMEAIAWSENLTAERCAEAGVGYRDKRSLFAEADFVSIHLRLSERTRGLVGAEEFYAMKRDAYLINTSRAPIVDQQALERALVGDMIAGAGLDVFDQEPLPPDHWLLSTPKVLLTPHIGYVTRETYAIFYGETLAAIEAWLDGKPIRTIAA